MANKMSEYSLMLNDNLCYSGKKYYVWLIGLAAAPEGKTIEVKNYSPLYEKFNTDPDNQFIINI